jgi:hypothetical protein
MVFSVLKEILRLEFLDSFVMNFVSLPMYVNLDHFVFSFYFFLLSFFMFYWNEFVQE